MDSLVLFLLCAILLGAACRLSMFLGNVIAYQCSKVSWMSHFQFFALSVVILGTASLLAYRGLVIFSALPVFGGMFLVFTFIGMCQTWISRHRRQD